MNRVVARLKRDVVQLALPAGRMVGSPGHKQAREYLLGRMGQLSLLPYREGSCCLPYEIDQTRFTNLIGVVPGSDRRAAPILIGAHYDSVIPAPCADDNAAAVAVALFAAERLKRGNLRRDLVVALFDAEEPPFFQTPLMGSIRFYEDQRDERGFHAAVIMDLVGHDVLIPATYLQGNRLAASILGRFPFLTQRNLALPIVRDLVFLTGAESHPAVASVVGQAKRIRRLRPIAALNEYVGDMSDQGVFRACGVPYLFFSCGRWPHYHAPTDTPDRLNYHKMRRIANLLIQLVAALDGTDLPAHHEPIDTTDLEIRLIRKAFGPLLRPLLKLVGLSHLATRSDLDLLAQALLTAGL